MCIINDLLLLPLLSRTESMNGQKKTKRSDVRVKQRNRGKITGEKKGEGNIRGKHMLKAGLV